MDRIDEDILQYFQSHHESGISFLTSMSSSKIEDLKAFSSPFMKQGANVLAKIVSFIAREDDESASAVLDSSRFLELQASNYIHFDNAGNLLKITLKLIGPLKGGKVLIGQSEEAASSASPNKYPQVQGEAAVAQQWSWERLYVLTWVFVVGAICCAFFMTIYYKAKKKRQRSSLRNLCSPPILISELTRTGHDHIVVLGEKTSVVVTRAVAGDKFETVESERDESTVPALAASRGREEAADSPHIDTIYRTRADTFFFDKEAALARSPLSSHGGKDKDPRHVSKIPRLSRPRGLFFNEKVLGSSSQRSTPQGNQRSITSPTESSAESPLSNATSPTVDMTSYDLYPSSSATSSNYGTSAVGSYTNNPIGFVAASPMSDAGTSEEALSSSVDTTPSPISTSLRSGTVPQSAWRKWSVNGTPQSVGVSTREHSEPVVMSSEAKTRPVNRLVRKVAKSKATDRIGSPYPADAPALVKASNTFLSSGYSAAAGFQSPPSDWTEIIWHENKLVVTAPTIITAAVSTITAATAPSTDSRPRSRPYPVSKATEDEDEVTMNLAKDLATSPGAVEMSQSDIMQSLSERLSQKKRRVSNSDRSGASKRSSDSKSSSFETSMNDLRASLRPSPESDLSAGVGAAPESLLSMTPCRGLDMSGIKANSALSPGVITRLYVLLKSLRKAIRDKDSGTPPAFPTTIPQQTPGSVSVGGSSVPSSTGGVTSVPSTVGSIRPVDSDDDKEDDTDSVGSNDDHVDCIVRPESSYTSL